MTVSGHEVEARYRQALRDQPSVSKVTLADGQLVEVKDIYVHRTLLHEVVQKQPERESRGGEPDATDFESQREITVKLPVDLWPKLRDERVVLVEGLAGMGKSTLTKQLVRESETHHRIPIWIPFRQFVSSGLSILEYLDQYYIPWLGLSDLRLSNRTDETGRDRSLGQWCYDQWQSGLGVLILDGLDEVFRHEERVAALKALPITGTARTRPATILTSRPLTQSLPLQMAKLDVQGLTPSDQELFIERYRSSLQLTDEQITCFTGTTQKEEQRRLQSLLTRPGHLIQILSTYARTNTLLDTETAVLNSLLDSRLTITGRSEPPVEGNDKKKRQVLLSLALHLSACRQGQRHTRAQLLTLIHQILREHRQAGTPLFPLSQATAVLNDLARNSALLTEVEPEVYEFETVIWLQYLTGYALADLQTIAALGLTESHVLDFLDKKAWDPEWEPVLKSWVGQAHNPLPLFDRLMTEEADDLARHRLGVLGRCLIEVRSELQSQTRYQSLATRFSREAFEVWKMNGKRGTAQLVTRSLGTEWIGADIRQTMLQALLQGPLSIMRKLAIKALKPIIPRALQWWGDSNEDLRRATATALRRLGAATPVPVQEVFLVRLADSDWVVRHAVVEALGGLGTAMAVSVQQALLERLADPDWAMRDVVVEIFGKLGEAMPGAVQDALMARLEDSDENVRGAAVEALGGLGPAMPGAVQDALMARLEDPDENVCGAAVKALGGQGPAMLGAVQQSLVARLTDSNGSLRWGAYEALGELGAALPVAVQETLVARLDDPDERVRYAVLEALGELREAMSASVQEALMARLMDPDWSMRQVVVTAPSRYGYALVRVGDPNGSMHYAVVTALGKLGMAMPFPVQDALVAMLVDSDRAKRQAVVEALGKSGAVMPVLVQQTLVTQLADTDEHVRLATIEALMKLETTMLLPAQEALVAMLVGSGEIMQQAVVTALRRLGATMAVSVQEALMHRLVDSDWAIRQAVVTALGGLGTAMPIPVQKAILLRLMDRDWAVRRAAVGALRGLGMAMPVDVQEVLLAQLADSNKGVRRSAVEDLGKLGVTMSRAVQDALVARLSDSNRAVREASVETISSAQQQGLRFFPQGSFLREGRRVSELSATAPFSDMCHSGNVHAPAVLAISAPHRLPLTAV